MSIDDTYYLLHLDIIARLYDSLHMQDGRPEVTSLSEQAPVYGGHVTGTDISNISYSS